MNKQKDYALKKQKKLKELEAIEWKYSKKLDELSEKIEELEEEHSELMKKWEQINKQIDDIDGALNDDVNEEFCRRIWEEVSKIAYIGRTDSSWFGYISRHKYRSKYNFVHAQYGGNEQGEATLDIILKLMEEYNINEVNLLLTAYYPDNDPCWTSGHYDPLRIKIGSDIWNITRFNPRNR